MKESVLNSSMEYCRSCPEEFTTSKLCKLTFIQEFARHKYNISTEWLLICVFQHSVVHLYVIMAVKTSLCILVISSC
jgi:hypothetical protein